MKVLVCPLDWGLGHATRCIPLIRILQASGHEVLIGAGGGGLRLLKEEFPNLKIFPFSGYRVRYSRSPALFLSIMLVQIPNLLLGFFRERRQVNRIIEEYHPDLVIADGRYGVYSAKIPCIFITHQVFIRVPGRFWGKNVVSSLILKLNERLLKRFQEVWIPDYPGQNNLSGELSHGKTYLRNLVFIGPLSRFNRSLSQNSNPKTELNTSIEFLAMVSGPEPQRTLFEDLLRKQLAKMSGTRVLIRGLPGSTAKNAGRQVVLVENEYNEFSHLSGQELVPIIQKAKWVVARTGYTTVMELTALGINSAILVPTPGQSEQEYLGSHLQGLKICRSIPQEDLDLTGMNFQEKTFLGFNAFLLAHENQALPSQDNFNLEKFIRNHPLFHGNKGKAQAGKTGLFRTLAFLLGLASLFIRNPYGDEARIQFYQSRLNSYLSILQKSDSSKPYFLAYRVNDTLYHSFAANKGGVVADRSGSTRYLNVEARVGSGKFDNTHPMRENLDFTTWDGYQNVLLPLEKEGPLTEKTLKIATDFAFRAAKDQFIKIKANVGVRPAEEDTGLDFANAGKVHYRADNPQPMATRKSLDTLFARIKIASKQFANRPHLYSSQIDLQYRQVQKLFVNSEGTTLIHHEMLGNIGIYVETKAEDGMILWLTKDFFFKEIPLGFSLDTLVNATQKLLVRLDSLRQAPVMETFVGPVILENTAAAVFVHEVFGHRIEGHRQKAVDEGQTFANKINQQLTSSSISIYDDPTLEYFDKTPLNGFYRFDDEGVKSQKTMLLNQGKFKDFLLSRSVLTPTGSSNGHGRGVLGLPATARMGNTILESSQNLPFQILKDSLRTILKKMGKPYGLLLHDISGGFTYTGRDLPQSFRVEPLYVSQIFADGRPDRLVRGVDAVGTPLVSLKQIVAAGNDPGVFNGYCGAESGWIPVSAISPSLLLESMEFESRAKDQNLPPILPPPMVHPR